MTGGALMPRGGLVAIQREQAVLMQQPMVGTPMVGDPRIHGMTVGDHTGAPRSIKGAFGHLTWRIGQYAAAMLAKAGIVGADASGLEARFEPPATVVFTLPLPPPDFDRPPEQPVEIARYTVPAHVMAYDPTPARWRGSPVPRRPSCQTRTSSRRKVGSAAIAANRLSPGAPAIERFSVRTGALV